MEPATDCHSKLSDFTGVRTDWQLTRSLADSFLDTRFCLLVLEPCVIGPSGTHDRKERTVLSYESLSAHIFKYSHQIFNHALNRLSIASLVERSPPYEKYAETF
jgi:hypothetical protein